VVKAVITHLFSVPVAEYISIMAVAVVVVAALLIKMQYQ
jgi:hypothetical protein